VKILYINPPALMHLLQEFQASDWRLSPLPITPRKGDEDWDAAIHVYKVLQKQFVPAIDRSQRELSAVHNHLKGVLGQYSFETCLGTVEKALKKLREANRPYPSRLDEPFEKSTRSGDWDPRKLDEAVELAATATRLTSLRERAVYVSHVYRIHAPRLFANRVRLDEMLKVLRDEVSKLRPTVEGISSDDLEQKRQDAINKCQALIGKLKSSADWKVKRD
jgi:hypothetical protein